MEGRDAPVGMWRGIKGRGWASITGDSGQSFKDEERRRDAGLKVKESWVTILVVVLTRKAILTYLGCCKK